MGDVPAGDPPGGPLGGPPGAPAGAPLGSLPGPPQRPGAGYPSAALLGRLAAARLYVCVGRRPDLPAFARAVTGAGVDALQFRHKAVDANGAPDAAEFGEEVRAYTDLRAGAADAALVAVNDRADLAAVTGAALLHVGQHDLPPATARALLAGRDVAIGLSTHSLRQAQAALADPAVDYLCVGPVWTTPTKPGRPAVGLDLVRAVATLRPAKPWFAIGGIDAATLPAVLDAGAHRVVVVRAVTAPRDPATAGAAAAALRALLDASPLPATPLAAPGPAAATAGAC